MICPLMSGDVDKEVDCKQTECAMWHDEDFDCCFLTMAKQLRTAEILFGKFIIPFIGRFRQ